VDDLADACVFVMKHYSGDRFLNVGTGKDTTIAEFAGLVSTIVGYDGKLKFDTSRQQVLGPQMSLPPFVEVEAQCDSCAAL
jgi:nucleoside-diphosphate-sugar epimerase